MNTLSVIILAKNAENLLADCIESVAFADEVIVIDDASSDRTPEIAKKLGAKVVENSYKSFAEKRNYGLSLAKGEWIFYIDTDERVTPELRRSIQSVILGKKEQQASVAIQHSQYEIGAYAIIRKNFYLGKHAWPKVEKLQRLFKTSALTGWYGDLHESPKVIGKLGELPGYLLHFTHRDLTSMLEKTIVWSDAEAKLRLDANHPRMSLWRFPRVMLTAFWDSYIYQQGWKAGHMGLIESIFQAFSIFVTYAKLWELQQKSA